MVIFAKKALSARLEKPEKAEFTLVNEHFSVERNEAIDVLLLD